MIPTLLMHNSWQLAPSPSFYTPPPSTEPLSYLASGRPLTLTLARPCLTLTWDPATGAPRLPGALQLSSLPAVTLEPPHSSHPHLPQQQILRDLMRGQNSGAGAEGTGRSSKKARSKGTSTTTPSSSSSSSSQVLKRLQQADGVVGLSAELLLPTAQVYVAEGRLACPSELRWAGGGAGLGPCVMFTAVVCSRCSQPTRPTLFVCYIDPGGIQGPSAVPISCTHSKHSCCMSLGSVTRGVCPAAADHHRINTTPDTCSRH
jgi:hypothetical protein